MSEVDAEQPMTPDEAAAWLKLEKIGYNVATLERWAKDGAIEHITIGKRRMFLREHLVRFVRKGLPEGRTLRRVS
jgi:hypothetical protein